MADRHEMDWRALADTSALVVLLRSVTRTSRICRTAAAALRLVSRATSAPSSAVLLWMRGPSGEDLSDHVARVTSRSPAVLAVDGWLLRASSIWRDAATGRFMTDAARRVLSLDSPRRLRVIAGTAIVAAATSVSLTPKIVGYHGLAGLVLLLSSIGFATLLFRGTRRS